MLDIEEHNYDKMIVPFLGKSGHSQTLCFRPSFKKIIFFQTGTCKIKCHDITKETSDVVFFDLGQTQNTLRCLTSLFLDFSIFLIFQNVACWSRSRILRSLSDTHAYKAVLVSAMTMFMWTVR